MKPLAPNTLLQNRYLIVQLIGKGGMGEVYLAVDQRLGSAIAIKRTTIAADDAVHLAAFETEAKTLARLRHPALTKVSDHFTENGKQFLVMEHISGDDLYKRLEVNQKPFPLDWVLYWGSQLLDALTYLHSQEPPIIHRDIKPQNLKLTDENNIILLDFGLAQSQPDSNGGSSSGNSTGYTPHYASLEQIRGTGSTPRSDIYSFSATIYHLLTNVVPPDALKRADQILNHFPDPVEPVNEINPDVSGLISDVILKGMSLAAEQRYQSAGEMQQALKNAYDNVQELMSAQTVAFSLNPAKESENSEMGAASVAAISQMPAGGDWQLKQDSDVDRYPDQSEFSAGDATARLDQIQPENRFESYPSEDNQSFSNDHQNSETVNLPAAYTSENGALPAEIPSENPQVGIPVNNQVSINENVYTEPLPRVENRGEPLPNTNLPPPPPVKNTAVKKTGGKSYALIGMILGFGIMLLAAGAVGFYFYKNSQVTAVSPTPIPISTPEPLATPAITPTPEPTIETTVLATDSNTNTNSENAIATNGSNESNATTSGNMTDGKPVSEKPVAEKAGSEARPESQPPRQTQPARNTSGSSTQAKTQQPAKTPAPVKKTNEKPKLGSKDLLPY